MNKNILIGIVVVVLIGGVLLFTNQKPQTENLIANPQQAQKEASKDEGKMVAGYSGKVLAGSKSPYIAFTKADYDKAKSAGKVVFLDFYANWCPICREEAPILKEGFDALQNDKIVGFRVNYNDTETDADEKKLASEFSIPYQHTKVILKNGKEIFRTQESWDKETFNTEINKAVAQ